MWLMHTIKKDVKEKGKVISASEKPKNRMKMEIEEVSSYGALPLLSLNHVSLLCRSVWDSVRFYEDVLGFVLIKRPSSFNFNGAWLVINICFLEI